MKFVHENKQPNQTTAITYAAPRPVNIGDVFYLIEGGQGKTYNAPCRVCGGAGKLTVNGVTFKCPQCDEETAVLYVRPYVVRRYRVYGISAEAGTDTWKPSDSRTIKVNLYKKTDRTYYGCTVTTKYIEDFEKLNEKRPEAIYDDYKAAVAYADELTAKEIAKVAEYNAEHGTNYEPPVFEDEHDQKDNGGKKQ